DANSAPSVRPVDWRPLSCSISHMRHIPYSLALTLLCAAPAVAQHKPRERDLGIPIGGEAGPLDAITDVAGVEVGYATLIRGDGKLIVGQGPVRTGVTIIFPRGRN